MSDIKGEFFTVDGVCYEYKDVSGNTCYVSATEWMNGEGYDIEFQDDFETKSISLSFDALYAMNAVIGMLETK